VYQKDKGQVEVFLLLTVLVAIIVGVFVFVAIGTQQTKQQEEEKQISKMAEKWEKAWDRPDFYGERLIVACLPEDAFKLEWNNIEKRVYILRYKEKDKDKVDFSIYSYAIFDPNYPNTVEIDLYNESSFPIEMDYLEDRYYIRTYGDNVYQLDIDMEWESYEKVINPKKYRMIFVKYPSSLKETDIKSLLIKLKRNSIIIGLQKISG